MTTVSSVCGGQEERPGNSQVLMGLVLARELTNGKWERVGGGQI